MQTYFFKVKTPDGVKKILKGTSQPLSSESISISESLGRVLSRDIISPIDLPGFERSKMDGFAVRAKDTFGASQGSPAYLNVIGEVRVGEKAIQTLSSGETVKVSTGSMMPSGADAVVIVEYTDFLDDKTIEVVRSVAPGDDVVQRNEDLKVGDIALKKGHSIRPQDIGALAGCGITSVECARQPKVAIISSGDEVIPPDREASLGQIRDINSYSLLALTQQAGGIPIMMGIVKDSFDLLKAKMAEALKVADIAIISGGSSVGTRDITLDVIKSLTDSEILVHGVSIKPGKPTIMAKAGDKYIFGLPGNPVSVMVTFNLFVGYLIELLMGMEQPAWEKGQVRAKLTKNIASAPGREDYICVRLVESSGELMAEPVLGKSALINMMVKADGLIKVPLEAEGLEGGFEVDVSIFGK